MGIYVGPSAPTRPCLERKDCYGIQETTPFWSPFQICLFSFDELYRTLFSFFPFKKELRVKIEANFLTPKEKRKNWSACSRPNKKRPWTLIS